MEELSFRRMSEIIQCMTHLCYESNWSAVNRIVNGIDPNEHPDYITAILRTVFVERKRIPRWQEKIDQCYRAAVERGESPAFLAGLIDVQTRNGIFLEYVIDTINVMIAERDFEKLDAYVSDFSVNHDITALIGLCRATFPVRSKLPSWSQKVIECRDAIDLRGLNGNVKLKGLI